MSLNEKLDRFLADNQELEQLTARLAAFNVFRALKIEKVEIRHSNTLGWLLDPNESHGLGDIVLRRVLSNMLLESEAAIPGVSAAKVELMEFSDVEVWREWKHIDIVVIDRGNKLVLLIENKIGSGEGEGQLARYREVVGKEFASFKFVPVFLTIEGVESDDEEAVDYISYSHAQLLAVVERIVEQRQSQLSEPVAGFLHQYMQTLRRLTMQDKQLTDLCRRIYRKHREAIDLIVEYGMASVFTQTAVDVLKKDGEYEILCERPNEVWFMPASWTKVVPENGNAWQHLTRPVSVACWLHKSRRDKMYLKFEVCRMNDPKLRMRCVEHLREAGFKLTKRAFDEDAKYSRFLNDSRAISEFDNEEELRDAVDKLLTDAKEDFQKALAVLREVFKK
jgi:hypothetical protein